VWVFIALNADLTSKDLKYASSGDAFHALRQTRKIVKNVKQFFVQAKNNRFLK
jgi:hypothetical protein